MPASELGKLEALAAHLRPDERPKLFLFSRSGFEDPLPSAADRDPGIRLVSPERM